MPENNFKINVYRDDKIEAFGAYAATSIKKGEGIVLLNVEANLACSIENKIPIKEIFVETLMHALGHALEEWYDLNFDEDRIDKIIDSYRKKYGKNLSSSE